MNSISKYHTFIICTNKEEQNSWKQKQIEEIFLQQRQQHWYKWYGWQGKKIVRKIWKWEKKTKSFLWYIVWVIVKINVDNRILVVIKKFQKKKTDPRHYTLTAGKETQQKKKKLWYTFQQILHNCLPNSPIRQQSFNWCPKRLLLRLLFCRSSMLSFYMLLLVLLLMLMLILILVQPITAIVLDLNILKAIFKSNFNSEHLLIVLQRTTLG